MLAKRTGAGEVVPMVLACDPAVAGAQYVAAHKMLLESDALMAATLAEMGEPEGVAPAPDVLARGAIVIGDGRLARFRGSSDVDDLLAVPDAAARVHIRIPASGELARAERTAGPSPMRGRAIYLRAVTAATVDRARFAEVYAEFLDSLDERDREAFDAFVEWVPQRDAWTCAAFIERIDGIDLDRGPIGYPIQTEVDETGRVVSLGLLDSVLDAPTVISEIAVHIRTLGALGKPARLPSLSACGSRSDEAEAGSGPAPSAPETTSCTDGEAAAAAP